MGEQIPLPRPEIRQSPALGRRCIADENPRLLDQGPLKDELSILSPEKDRRGCHPDLRHKPPASPKPAVGRRFIADENFLQPAAKLAQALHLPGRCHRYNPHNTTPHRKKERATTARHRLQPAANHLPLPNFGQKVTFFVTPDFAEAKSLAE